MTIFRCSAADGFAGGVTPSLTAIPVSICGKLIAGAVALAICVLASPAAAQQVAVPSGVDVNLFDVRLEQEPPLARFRFVVPAIDPQGKAKTFSDMVDDLQYLCDAVVIPALAQNAWSGEKVVLSLASAKTEFGVYDEAVLQFFQPFQITGDTCIWEDF